MLRNVGDRTELVLVWDTGTTGVGGGLLQGLEAAGFEVVVQSSAPACMSEALQRGVAVFVVQADALGTEETFWLDLLMSAGLGPVLGHGRVWTQLDDTGVRVIPERLIEDDEDALAHYLHGAMALYSRAAGSPSRRWRGTEAPEEFVVDTIHEFRTPVAVVHSYAELLRDGIGGDLNSRQIDYIERILESSRRAVQLFDDFVSSYRLRLFEERLEPDSLEVSNFVEKCLTGFAPEAVTTAIAPLVGERLLDVDGDDLHRSLRRVLEWAARFGSGPPSLMVDVEQGYVVFDVSFEGPIPSRHDIEVLQVGTLFDGVQRKSVTKVFGVGVELARTLLAGMGAKIELIARNEGGVFRMRVPASGGVGQRLAA